MRGICPFCKKDFKKREAKRKFCSLLCANRFNLNRKHNVVLPKKSEELAEFIGICLGDGSAWGYQVSVTLNARNDKEYILYVRKLAEELFKGAYVNLVYRKDNAVDVRITSKMVVDFLKANGIVSHTKYIPLWIKKDKKFIFKCIRGLIDTEGSISFKLYKSRQGTSLYKQLNFRNIDRGFMQFVRDGLVSMRLQPTTSLKKSLYLSNPASILSYRQVIGFGNPKLLKRSMINSIDEYTIFLTQTME